MKIVSKQDAFHSSIRLMHRNQGPAVSPSEAPKKGPARCPAHHERRNRCEMYSSATVCQAGRTRIMPVMANFASSGA